MPHTLPKTHIRRIGLVLAIQVLLTVCPKLAAQTTLSQNQDGFNGERMDGFMDTEPDKDSTVVERSVSKDYFQWVMNPNTGLPLEVSPDTLHHSFHNVHLTEGMKGTYSHLGNMGSPRLSRLYFERKETGDFMFDSPYGFWIKNPTDFRFTDTKSPHVSLDYYKGGDRRTGEERIKGYFAANFNRKVGIGMDMDYLIGRGRYDSQSTSFYDARLYTYYRGDIYSMYVTAGSDKMRIAENGGIQDTRYITNPEAMAEGRKSYSPEDIPFRLYYHWNNLKRKQALLSQNIMLSVKFSRTDSIGDTVFTTTRKVEFGKLAHTFQISGLQRNYINYQMQNGFYERQFLHNDSTDTARNFQLTNTLSLSLLEGATKWAKAGLSAYARYDYQTFTMPDTLGGRGEYMRRYSKGNFSVGASLEKAQGDNLTFKAGAETVLLGQDLGDFILHGEMLLKYPLLGKDARIGANAALTGQAPSFYMQKFHSTFAWWDRDFDKEFKTHICGFIDIEKTGTRLQADVENVAGYVYLANMGSGAVNGDGITQPTYDIQAFQNSGSIQIVSATLQQNLALGPLHWDNNVTWQLSGNREIIPLPDLNVFSDLYFKFLYAKRLQMEIGANATWFSKYTAPGYCPAAGMYHLQNPAVEQEVGGYPLLTGYVNCNLRGVRFYAMYYHVNDGLLANRNSFIVPGYPANPGMFKFGLSWTFFD